MFRFIDRFLAWLIRPGNESIRADRVLLTSDVDGVTKAEDDMLAVAEAAGVTRGAALIPLIETTVEPDYQSVKTILNDLRESGIEPDGELVTALMNARLQTTDDVSAEWASMTNNSGGA